jgi:hypothetical protein
MVISNMETFFRNVFICYSRTDEIQAMNIYHLLRAQDFDVFLDQINILPGTAWEPKTLSALHNANFIVIVLTEGSAERNGYAMKEIRRALELYHHDDYARRMLFPLRIGDAELPEGLSQFQWTSYSVEGLDRMVLSFRNQQKIWEEEISSEGLFTVPIFSFRESWPLISLVLILLSLIAIMIF